MKVIIEGTQEEIESAKDVLNSTCMFASKFCEVGLECSECEKKQQLITEFVIR